MDPHLRALLVFPDNLSLVPSSKIGWFTSIHNSNSRGPATLFWTLWASAFYRYRHTHTHTQRGGTERQIQGDRDLKIVPSSSMQAEHYIFKEINL